MQSMEVPGQCAGESKGTAAGAFELQQASKFRVEESANQPIRYRTGQGVSRLSRGAALVGLAMVAGSLGPAWLSTGLMRQSSRSI